MTKNTCTKEKAELYNQLFEAEVYQFLSVWAKKNKDRTLLRFDQPLAGYLANDALRDLFLNHTYPVQKLLKNRAIARHLGRHAGKVYFDPVTGDPLLSVTEQRIYNLARRMDGERMHIPFRSVHPAKQTEAGDTANISTYPADSQEIRYNSGNHFASRPANANVFNENSNYCAELSDGNLSVFFKRGFMEERLQEVKALTAERQQAGETETLFFVICSRHTQKEGHFGVTLVVMEPQDPDFPKRVMVCDTLLKDLPHHPRWWHYFIAEYTQVFGEAVIEMIEDISHPLQKVNISGDDPYRHDWDCPYYATSMAAALAGLVTSEPELVLNANTRQIHDAMKSRMPDYYKRSGEIKTRTDIQYSNRLKRWKSGRSVIRELVKEVNKRSSYEF